MTKMDKADLEDRICTISSFLTGNGTVAEIAAQKLRELMDEIDERGVERLESIIGE